VEKLKEHARPVKGSSEIKSVAAISAGNDEEIGQMIADALDKASWVLLLLCVRACVRVCVCLCVCVWEGTETVVRARKRGSRFVDSHSPPVPQTKHLPGIPE
jgi:hypothetical protein